MKAEGNGGDAGMITAPARITTLGKAVEFLDSKRRPVKSADRKPGPYPYFGANGQQGTIDGFIFDEPLVLLAEDGGHFFEPGRGIAYKIAGKTWVNNHAHVLRPKAGVDVDYLCLVLKHRDVTPHLTGSTRAKLTKAGASRIEIPLPPLAEQKRIAGILDAADALRAKRRESLAQLDTLLQSTFLDLFGDPVTNPMGWEQKPLGSICDVGSSKRVFVNELKDEGIPFYRGTEIGQLGEGRSVEPSLFITQEHYDDLRIQSGVPKIGDLLLPSICPDGRIFLVEKDEPFYFKDGRVLWIKSGDSPINSTFLRFHLKHLFFANYLRIASGTTFAELKIFALKDLIVHFPPASQQRRFAAIVASVERQKARLRAHLAELDALFASLQSRAFNGEL